MKTHKNVFWEKIMKNKSLMSIVNNKILLSVFTVLLFAAINLPYWLDVSDYQGNYNFTYKMIFFSLIGFLWILALYYFISELKKINGKIWKPVLIAFLAIGFLINYRYGGLFFISGDKIPSFIGQPIMWMLIATLVGNVVLFIYKRNKPQIA